MFSGGRYFDYLFFIDFEASMAEPRAQYALGHLQVSLYFMMLEKMQHCFVLENLRISYFFSFFIFFAFLSRNSQDFFVSSVAIR